jgi:hypothetical protein
VRDVRFGLMGIASTVITATFISCTDGGGRAHDAGSGSDGGTDVDAEADTDTDTDTGSTPDDGGAPAVPALDGAFIWIGEDMASWTQARWNAEIGWMSGLGMTRAVTAASVLETDALYPTAIDGLAEVAGEPIEKLLTAADDSGIEVHVGLVLTDTWWNNTDGAFLDDLAARSEAVATELWDLYGAHPSLIGFYLPQEIDNMTWIGEDARVRLIDHYLSPLSEHVKALNPSLVVSSAPFFNTEYQGAVDYGAWWDATLADTPSLDLLMPQDGIGAEHATLADVGDYFAALGSACADNGREMWTDLEVYELDGDTAAPADMARIADQLDYETPLVGGSVCWELGYIAPSRGPASLGLYLDYRRYLAGKGAADDVALDRGYSFSLEPDAAYPDPSGALTDGEAPLLFSENPGWWAPGEITVDVDLGAATDGLAIFTAHFLRSDGSAAVSPEAVQVLSSTDASSFVPIGALAPLLDEDENVNVWLLEAPASARFVRFDISAPSGWLFVSELSVFREGP